jgi:MFS family permease
MLSSVAPIAALLLSVAFLLMGNGLQGTLLPVRANLESFASAEIGLIGTAYFIGFGAGCYFGGRIVRHAGHIRTFSAMASLASAIALVHAMFVFPPIWWAFRAITGFCFAVLYVVIESWLNERSTNETRGRIFSIYTVINLTVITAGQMMLMLYDPGSFPLFALASVLVSLAVLPVAMTKAVAPSPVEKVRLRPGYLYSLSPVGCAGALTVGLANGAFWAMAPVFAQDSGFDTAGIALFMSIAVLAGAVGQWPLGQLSDRHDRRKIIFATCIIGALGGAGMTLFQDRWTEAVFVFVAIYGVAAFPLYALCVAHLNDYVAADEFVEASSVMLLLYAAGAALGAVPSSLLMAHMGPEGLFAFTAIVHVGFAVFTLMRMRQRGAPAEKSSFIGVPRTSPALYALDPRGEDLKPSEAPEQPDQQEGQHDKQQTQDSESEGLVGAGNSTEIDAEQTGDEAEGQKDGGNN